jgi:hypothetical protein
MATVGGGGAVNRHAFKTWVLYGVQWPGSCSDQYHFSMHWITSRWTTVRLDVLLKNRRTSAFAGIKLWSPSRIRSARWLRRVCSLYTRRSRTAFLNRGSASSMALQHILFPFRVLTIWGLLPLLLRRLFYNKVLHCIKKGFYSLRMFLFVNTPALMLPRVVLSGPQIEWILPVSRT